MLPCDQLGMHERQCDGRVRVAFLANAGCRAAHHLNPGCAGACVSMSEAVEGAELMLYGVSEKYKER